MKVQLIYHYIFDTFVFLSLAVGAYLYAQYEKKNFYRKWIKYINDLDEKNERIYRKLRKEIIKNRKLALK